jgi:hypothetical protein
VKSGEIWMDKRPEHRPHFYGKVTLDKIYVNYVIKGIYQGECVGFTTSWLQYVVYKREYFIENFEKVY